MADVKIAVLVGSLRKDSLNRKLAVQMLRLLPAGFAGAIVEIGDLPLYNDDLDAAPPEAWVRFRGAVAASDAVLFVTPEYNRSVPGALKNAIDVGSRPYGKSVYAGKPAAVVSLSPGGIGGFGANHHLRQSLVFLDMPVMQQPEAYLGGAGTMFAADGGFAKPETEAFIGKIVGAFAAWVGKVRG